MISLPIDQITEATLRGLIDANAVETKTLEFKRDMPGRDNAARTEFLADVCAMANAGGGDIVFGVEEDDEGTAQALRGHDVNPDDECLRLQNIVTDGLEPKLTGVTAHAVRIAAGGIAIVLRIPLGWAGPYRSRVNMHFYIREGRRKRSLDVPEIRTAVLRSQEPASRLDQFRRSRFEKLLTGGSPVALRTGVVETLLIVPMDLWLAGNPVNVLQFTGDTAQPLPVISGTGGNWRINIDGALHSRPVTAEGCGAYTQLYRNGALEATRVFTGDSPIVPGVLFERELISYYENARRLLVGLGSTGPLVLQYSLLHADGVRLGLDRNRSFFDLNDDQGAFDRDVVVIPDVLASDVTENAGRQLRPLFDLIWNAAGLPQSWNYNTDGNWQAHA